MNNTEFQVLELEEVDFESIFGVKKSNQNHTYCLLGTGFFRTPRSDNSDSLINDWMQNHQDAKIIPVCSHGPVMIDAPDSRMVYCWVIDGSDTLNTYLVREGCFPGGTMIRPKTWEEMADWEKELYDGSDQKPNVQVLVKDVIYDRFINQISIAESYAKKEGIGIWESE